MTFINVCALLIICSLSVLIFSNKERELTVIISSALYIIVMIYAVTNVGQLFKMLEQYISNISFFDFDILLKIGGISVICAVTSSICESTGQKGLASAIETVAVVEIIVLILPTVKETLSKILSIIGD